MAVVVSALVTRVEKRLRMVAGVSVQLYAEDHILHSIQTAFDRLFMLRWWPSYMSWSTWTLDGATGKITSDLTALIKDFVDIRKIWYDTSDESLSRVPANLRAGRLTGTRARYWEPLKQDVIRVFRILPITTTGDVHVHYRTKPNDFATDDTIYLDALLLELAAAYEYVIADGANPGHGQMLLGMLKEHFRTVDTAQDDDEFELVRGYGDVPNRWH